MNYAIRLFVTAALLLPVLSGCYPDLIRTGPVVDEAVFLGPPGTARIDYSRARPIIASPIIPFRTLGVKIDDSVRIEIKNHRRWWTFEICRVDLPDGSPFWFSIDTENDGTQYVGLPGPGYQEVVRGMPGRLYQSGLIAVCRAGEPGRLLYEADYTLPDGFSVSVSVNAPEEMETLELRNSDSANLSENDALLVIDTEKEAFAKASVMLGGRPHSTRRGYLRLRQTTRRMSKTLAGIVEGRMRIRSDAAAMALLVDDRTGERRFEAMEEPGRLILSARDLLGEDRFIYLLRGGYLELDRVERLQGGREIMKLRFNPPLPDLRFHPLRTAVSRITLEVNGRPGYLSGTVTVVPDEKGARLLLAPEAPSWCSRRPVQIRTTVLPGGEVIVTSIIKPREVAADAE